MLYISTQVSRKWPGRTRQMECSGTLPQPAPLQLERSPTLCWTDADSHAGADLQGFINLGDGAGSQYASSSDPVSNGRPANFEVATTQSCRLPKKDADQIKESHSQTDSRTNKRAKVAKWTVSKAAAARAGGNKQKRSCKSDDVFDSGRRDVDERTRRDLDEFDDE